jgi:hypothetical protein
LSQPVKERDLPKEGWQSRRELLDLFSLIIIIIKAGIHCHWTLFGKTDSQGRLLQTKNR